MPVIIYDKVFSITGNAISSKEVCRVVRRLNRLSTEYYFMDTVIFNLKRRKLIIRSPENSLTFKFNSIRSLSKALHGKKRHKRFMDKV